MDDLKLTRKYSNTKPQLKKAFSSAEIYFVKIIKSLTFIKFYFILPSKWKQLVVAYSIDPSNTKKLIYKFE